MQLGSHVEARCTLLRLSHTNVTPFVTRAHDCDFSCKYTINFTLDDPTSPDSTTLIDPTAHVDPLLSLHTNTAGWLHSLVNFLG